MVLKRHGLNTYQRVFVIFVRVDLMGEKNSKKQFSNSSFAKTRRFYGTICILVQCASVDRGCTKLRSSSIKEKKIHGIVAIQKLLGVHARRCSNVGIGFLFIFQKVFGIGKLTTSVRCSAYSHIRSQRTPTRTSDLLKNKPTRRATTHASVVWRARVGMTTYSRVNVTVFATIFHSEKGIDDGRTNGRRRHEFGTSKHDDNAAPRRGQIFTDPSSSSSTYPYCLPVSLTRAGRENYRLSSSSKEFSILYARGVSFSGVLWLLFAVNTTAPRTPHAVRARIKPNSGSLSSCGIFGPAPSF